MSVKRGELWNATWEEYLAERVRWSSTFLGDLLDKGPRFAFGRLNGEKLDKDTPARRKGRLTHTAIWEGPKVFAERYLVADRRTTEGKKAAAEATERGAQVVPAADYGIAMNMAEAVAAAAFERAEDGEPFLADLLASPGRREQSILWEDEETGSLLKARLDKLVEKAPVVADLKTARRWQFKWEEFIRDSRNYGYHRQAWIYCDAYKAVYGVWPRYFLIVVHNEAPYEVALYEFGEGELELGRKQARRAMRRAAAHVESGKWRAPEERGINKIIYPPFVYQDEELAS